MEKVLLRTPGILSGLVVLGLSGVISTTAIAGGFAIREQSVSGLGAAFAGNGAGYDLSTIYWNPAGVAIAGPGLTTESHYSVIIPDIEIDPDDSNDLVALAGLPGGTNDIGKAAFVPSSYAAWRINDKWTIGYGFNAPFGLANEADDKVWAGQYDIREAELLTYNFNPVVGYQISPTLAIGVGLQVMYTDLDLKQAIPVGMVPAATDPTLTFEGQDWSVGYTLGLLWRPAEGTSIGIGYRSQMDNTLEGDQKIEGTFIRGIEADFDLPSILTVSFRQALSPNMRLLGTFEWTDWDVLDTVVIKNQATGGAIVPIVANWDDSYFLSAGLEYDYNSNWTLRTGVGYEWSPSQDPDQKLVSVPDDNRVWLSIGATYKYSETTTFDIAYTHIFVEDGDITRPTAPFFTGESEASADIIGVSFKTKWGADGPFGLLKGLTD